MAITTLVKEKYLRGFFDIGIIVKGVDGLLQIMGGVALIFLKPEAISHFVVRITQFELAEDPRDKVANFLLFHSSISYSSEKFAIAYLLIHGLINFFVAVSLLKNKLWAYPLGMVMFAGFDAYQLYKYFHTHSVAMLVLTIIDTCVILLTWHEYRVAKAKAFNT